MSEVRRGVPRWLILLVGYGVSIACLFWVYRGYNWAEQMPRLLATDLNWVGVAVFFGLITYVIQGYRWSALLRPVGTADAMHTTQAIFIGLFANEVLPLRPGEVIRCYLVRRWAGLPLEVVLSSAALERLIDGVILVVAFYSVARFETLPVILVQASRVLMGALAILATLVAGAMLYRTSEHPFLGRSRWGRVVQHVVDGVHSMGRSPGVIGVIVLSVLFMGIQVVPIWALIIGFGLKLSAWAALVIFVVLRLSTVVPFSPGNAGPFQFATVVALEALGVGKNLATNYATLLFVVITVPLWFAGFVALLATRMKLEEIHHEAHHTPAGR
jgi:uncharacterized protein (TIRG00374 family)